MTPSPRVDPANPPVAIIPQPFTRFGTKPYRREFCLQNIIPAPWLCRLGIKACEGDWVLPGEREEDEEVMRNRMLVGLPPAELARIGPKLQPVDLVVGRMLSEGDEPLDQVYFPEAGMISLVRPMLDGALVEVGVVGREGFVGMGVVLGADIGIVGKMVQSPGSGLSIPVASLRRELEHCPVLSRHLLSFVQALLSQVAQTTACNARHNVQQRLARWLLMARERADGRVLTLSHEFLSVMLGVRRPGVTVALGKYRQAGLVSYGHGKIEILDRDGLEAAACECFGQVKAVYKRLLP